MYEGTWKDDKQVGDTVLIYDGKKRKAPAEEPAVQKAEIEKTTQPAAENGQGVQGNGKRNK